jgi:hypothetical protein
VIERAILFIVGAVAWAVLNRSGKLWKSANNAVSLDMCQTEGADSWSINNPTTLIRIEIDFESNSAR